MPAGAVAETEGRGMSLSGTKCPKDSRSAERSEDVPLRHLFSVNAFVGRIAIEICLYKRV